MATTTTLISLPPELHLMFFNYLDPASAACFAVTTRHLYAICKSLHTRAQLYDFCVCPVLNHHGLFLFELLEKWIGPTLTFDIRSRKFLSPRLYLLSKRKETHNGQSSITWFTTLCDAQREAFAEARGKYVGGIWTPY